MPRHRPMGQPAINTYVALIATAALITLGACGSNTGEQPTQESAPSSEDASAPTVDGLFDVGDGRMLAIQCWGEGSPTVLYDAGTGDSGIAEASRSPVIANLALQTRTCSYDRAGLGASDPAPMRMRALDDVVDDLHALLAAAEIVPPYVFVGASGGGFDVFHQAGRYPDEVVGLVMLDVPAGQANIPLDQIPAWDSPENPEHIDYAAAERQMALERLPIPPIPVTVVTASAGQSADPAEQRVWLEGSSLPVQIVLTGGHEIFELDPNGVLTAIQELLAAI